MKVVNKELRAFDKFYKELDGFILIKIDDLDWIYGYVFFFPQVLALHRSLTHALY